MNYIDFKAKMTPFGLFTTAQAEMIFPGISVKNLYRWTEKNYLVKLRNGWYAFADKIESGRYNFIISNLIYQPSYISLETALSFYGIIPEAVVSTTAVTTLKTESYDNKAGNFSYRTINKNLYWGYERKYNEQLNRAYDIATPEKSIIDLLYLNTFIQTEEISLNCDLMTTL